MLNLASHQMDLQELLTSQLIRSWTAANDQALVAMVTESQSGRWITERPRPS